MTNNCDRTKPVFFAHWQQRSATELHPGIQVRSLWQGKNKGKAMVVTIEPQGKWGGVDVHETGSEEIYVVEGIFNDGNRDYEAGTFIHYPIGSSHVPQSDKGCTLFVFHPD